MVRKPPRSSVLPKPSTPGEAYIFQRQAICYELTQPLSWLRRKLRLRKSHPLRTSTVYYQLRLLECKPKLKIGSISWNYTSSTSKSFLLKVGPHTTGSPALSPYNHPLVSGFEHNEKIIIKTLNS
eukprot:TRINITY_DN35669_c2_g1_i1.p1 TRINITY_DN35669_c2_g1~~TRINITY_DN35669_c2_g1_i1.p1  ORF type:complete len:125 (+),score=8.02 TRINITY_DN35669_c2_g1_i1:369-743(+)